MSGTDNKNRKYGRTARSPSMAAYNAENRSLKNKILRVLRHYKKSLHSGVRDDGQAKEWLENNAPRVLASI